ncbi:tpr repeat protein [Sporothrix brasiliensis 5110]|uniref:Succinate dehydrogenase assembly factor 2, mitochondrial n=1 Tax=Sporothrix brasiliensis 5110 TaxID=1398154 RepID=A0A0C2FT33_9PEZI|nr:tpr repeat protein [Sporothrix brasiliensis 5110]KIH94153.1 tpr repeat protein [Sporothrix brasiliensis 5110]
MTAQRLLRPARDALRTLPYATPRTCTCRAHRSTSFFSTSSSPRSASSNDDVSRSGPINPQPASELQLGELPGGTFRIEPLRRVGEDVVTMRARLLYQSRKRGTLESDLLLSTFASAHLATMTATQLEQYDRFLDENDWDIYYWVTQEENTPATAADEGSGSNIRERPAHEWAQTVGTFKPAYRPVPARWQGSEILAMLRQHVQERSAEGEIGRDDGSAKATISKTKRTGEGMAFMPPLPDFGKK